MSYIIKKHKFIFKCIALVIIQAFITLDIAWAAGGDIFAPQDKIQAETLAPKLQLDAQAMQNAFFQSSKIPNKASDLTVANQTQPVKAKKSGFSFVAAAKNIVLVATILIMFIGVFARPVLAKVSAARAPPAQIVSQLPDELRQVREQSQSLINIIEGSTEAPVIYTQLRGSETEGYIFTNRAARQRAREINAWVDKMWKKSALSGQLPEYITKHSGDSIEEKVIREAKLLLWLVDREAYAVFEDRQVPIRIATIPDMGQTRASRWKGYWGQPYINLSKALKNNLFFMTVALAHESVHVDEMPGDVFSLFFKYNPFYVAKNTVYVIFSPLHPEESKAFARQKKLIEKFNFKRSAQNEFSFQVDLEGMYFEDKWEQLEDDWMGFLLFEGTPISIAVLILLILRGTGPGRGNRYRSASYRGANKSLFGQKPTRRGNRFKSILPFSFLAVKFIELLNASSSWAFSDQASSLATGEFGTNISLVIAGVLILSGVVRVMLKRFRNGKESGNDIQSILDAEIKKAEKQVEVGDESAAYKAWQAGKADSTILIDIDGMKLRNRMIGKNNVNMLLDNLVQKVVKTLSETRRFAAYFRNGDENWMVLDGGGNPDYARNIIEKIKIPVENTYFAVGCLEGEGGMDNRTLSVVEKLGGRVDLIGDAERVLIVPGASTNSGNQRLDDFIAKVNEEISNQQKLRGIEDGQITYIKRKISELDEPGIDNVINFTLSVGFSTGVKDYDEAKIAAARAEEVSKTQSKNGQSGRENIVFDEEVRRSSNRQRSQNVKGLALDDAEAFKEVEINASRKEKEAARAREEGEILSLDNIAQGVRPEWAPEVIYFHSREAFREYVTVLQQLYPERFRGAFTFTTQYLDYYDTEGKIAAFKKQYEKDASNLVDDRILLGDFKVINSALGQDRGDEAIAVGRVIPMVEAQTMWSDKYDVIFARGGPSTPTAIAIPKPEYADELSQTVPDNTDFQDFAVGVKEKVNEATDVKVGHVGVVYGMFESSNRPIGTIWQQHDKTLTVAESKFVVGRENETVLTYTTGTDGAWSELTVEDAKAARKDYIRWKKQQAKNIREALESKRIHEKLMLLKEPSISEEGQEIIRRFSIRQKEDFEEFIAKCQEDLLGVGGKFDEVQMNEFHKFGKHIEKLITKQRQLYPEAKGEDPCYVLNNAAMNIEGGFGDDFVGRFKANYYHKITQPNKNIDWNFHAFIVVRIGDYNFILDLGLMELLGSETGSEDIGIVLIPERIIDKNNTVLWPYVNSTVEKIVKSSEFIKWTKLGKKMIEPLLIKKSSTPSSLKIDVLVEQAI